ncbi:MAG: polysaccharide deacetylase family protein, partial [Candidatus Eisenbacteria bacterium]|nr:polysaccharide deacetylase family protein [Candidatus Eisenbacteria bacterium]
ERQREHWDSVLAEVVRTGPRVTVPIRERLKAGVKERFGAALRTADQNPVILTFHRVVDLEDPLEVSATCPWISLRTFEALLDRATREFEVVPLHDILRSSGKGRVRLALTFDDAWADNLHVAAPALSARGLPWAVFPATAYAGTDRRTWQDRLWEGALTLFRRGEPMPAVWRGVWPADPSRSRAELALRCQEVVARVKRWDPGQRAEILGTLPAPAEGGPPRYLGPSELKQLATAGVLVGSHTHEHVMLAQAGEEEVRHELERSAGLLCEWLGERPGALVYPNGSVSARVAALAREAGYRLGLTTREGRVESDADPMLLPRVDMTEERVAGADARFSYDRFRYELARVP